MEPLSHVAKRVEREPHMAWRVPKVRGTTGANSVCSLGRYAARFGVRCAIAEHPPA